MALFPIPDLPGVSGVISLLPARSPFDVAVTADGRTRYRLVATIDGLPEPRTLGDFGDYIAWAYTLSLDSAVKLGRVMNGTVDLGELSYAQFRILISAERRSAVTKREGRLVLRGTSPSARLRAHRDLLQPSAPGALRDSAAAMPDDMTAASSMHKQETSELVWSMPPVPASMPAMPGMAALTPPVAPFLPVAPQGADIASARPRDTVRLASGDTLQLESGFVRRSIGGRLLTTYAYNGRYPGPLIETTQGATIVVRYHNATDLPSSVHWHGVRLDNAFDGAVGVTQLAVPPGGTYLYRVHVPDAGVFWYHPHAREDIQQSLGLYGNLLVRPSAPRYYAPANSEATLMLSDLLLGGDGPTPYGATAATHVLMGRFGNVLLVNGEPRISLHVRRGSVVRFFLTNAATARPFNLSFVGARMKVVAADVGRFEREEYVSSVVIAPAQRYTVDVFFPRIGTVTLENRVQALAHLAGTFSPEVDTLGTVHVGPEKPPHDYSAQFDRLRRNSDVVSEVASLEAHASGPPDRTLMLTMRTKNLPAAVANMLLGINAAMDWNDGMPMMNWLTTSQQVEWVMRDVATGKENMAIDWRFQEGDVIKLRIFNDPSSSHAMDHPIHLHGQRFLVLARDGVAVTNRAWKDTVLIPAGETVDLLAQMSNPGRWMLHCHIAEHLSAGMMMAFTVDPH